MPPLNYVHVVLKAYTQAGVQNAHLGGPSNRRRAPTAFVDEIQVSVPMGKSGEHVTMCWGLSGWVEVEVEVEVAVEVEVGIRSIPAWRTALDAAGPYVVGNKTLA